MKKWQKTRFGVNFMVINHEDENFVGIDYSTFDDLIEGHEKAMKDLNCKPSDNLVIYTFSTEELVKSYNTTPNRMFDDAEDVDFEEPWSTDHIFYGAEFNHERVAREFEELANKVHGKHIEHWRDSQYWKGHPSDLYIVIVKMEQAIIDKVNKRAKEAEKQELINSVFK